MDGQQPQREPDPRERGLGALAVLPDELICLLLGGLDVQELLALSETSRLLRVFACEEPLWLAKHLERCRTPFDYRGSWRATYLAHHPACGRPELTASDLVPLTPVPGFSSPALYRRWYRCHVDLSSFVPPPPPVANGSSGSGSSGAIACITDAAGLSAEDFEARLDGPGQPALLGGLTSGWAGSHLEAWQPDALAARFGNRLFRVTKPFFSGGRTRMRLADYLAYSRQQHDEEPLYIFDANFGEAAPEMLGMYEVPHIFRHDLFACLGYRREDYRWLVAGPARSGASWHVDPSATSAWNTLLSGRKRWALYPPGRVPPGVEVGIDDEGMPDFQTPTSLQWFLEVYPQLPPEARPLEVLQGPGETIFLPAGWWHCVLNLDFTVAVTQNFVSPANLEAAVQWQALGAGSMFDPLLVPAYLQQQAQQAQQPSAPQEQQEEPAPPPAKRRRRERQRAQRSTAGRSAAGRSAAGQQAVSIPGADGQALNGASDEDRAADQAAAEDHLESLTLGFSRDAFLGPWLRGLLQQLGELQLPAAEGERQQGVGAATLKQDAPAGMRPQQQQQQQQGAPAATQQEQEQERLAERVWQLAQQWSDVERWRPLLEQACLAAGLQAPGALHEWLPLATGWCVVFEVHSAILKFYNAAHAPHAPAMACMEAAAYLAQDAAARGSATGGLGGGGGSGGGNAGGSGRNALGSWAPRLLGAGVLEGWREGDFGEQQQAAEQQAAAGLEAGSVAAGAAVAGGAEPEAETQVAAARLAAGPGPPLPFIAIEKAGGVTLGGCMERLTNSQWLVVAAAAGRSLAAFHAMPLQPAAEAAPAGACSGHASGGSGSGSGGSSACTAWVARDGIVWSSTAGTLDMRGEKGASAEAAAASLQRRQQQCLRLFPAAAAALGQRLPGSSGKGSSLAGAAATAAAGQAGAPASAAAANVGSSLAGNGSGPASPASSSCAACSAWQPFVSFLRRERRHAAKAHRREGSLPPQLQQQIDSYLPADPAVLIGHGGCPWCRSAAEDAAGQPADGGAVLGSTAGASCAGPCNAAHSSYGDGSSACGGGSGSISLPVWVHGDLTAENLLLSSALLDEAPTPQQAEQQQGAPCGSGNGSAHCTGGSTAHGDRGSGSGGGGSCSGGVTLIDFADSGHGDPLWDFVPLLLRSLRCSQAAAEAAFAAYCAALPQPPAAAGVGGEPAAKVAAVAAASESAVAAAAAASPKRLPACWPARPDGVRLSYVAMCYTLLHELGPVHDIFKRRPQLWGAPSLEAVQSELFGWLDGFN